MSKRWKDVLISHIFLMNQFCASDLVSFLDEVDVVCGFRQRWPSFSFSSTKILFRTASEWWIFTYIDHIYSLDDVNPLSPQLWGITQHNRVYKDWEGKGSKKGWKSWVKPLFQSGGEQSWLWDNKQGKQNRRSLGGTTASGKKPREIAKIYLFCLQFICWMKITENI